MPEIYELIDEKQFLLSRRTKMLSYPQYKKQMSELIDCFETVTTQNIAARLADPDDGDDNIYAVSSATEQRAWYTTKINHLQYSAGIAIEKLRHFFPDALCYWEEYAKYHESFHKTAPYIVAHMTLGDSGYWDAIRMTSFAILLGFSDELHRLCAIWDYGDQTLDGLLERLVAPFVPGRATPPDECTRHLPYFKLLKIFSAEPDKRPALMAKYMDDWYEASRREPYHDMHTPGGQHNFLGYWSFEAAAVTYLLDIDDSSYRNHEFYPRDLVDFARSLPRPVELGGDEAHIKLRCEANQPCPKAGYWWTPAKENSRAYFKQNEIMPDFPSSNYGATIWQWDSNQSTN